MTKKNNKKLGIRAKRNLKKQIEKQKKEKGKEVTCPDNEIPTPESSIISISVAQQQYAQQQQQIYENITNEINKRRSKETLIHAAEIPEDRWTDYYEIVSDTSSIYNQDEDSSDCSDSIEGISDYENYGESSSRGRRYSAKNNNNIIIPLSPPPTISSDDHKNIFGQKNTDMVENSMEIDDSKMLHEPPTITKSEPVQSSEKIGGLRNINDTNKPQESHDIHLINEEIGLKHQLQEFHSALTSNETLTDWIINQDRIDMQTWEWPRYSLHHLNSPKYCFFTSFNNKNKPNHQLEFEALNLKHINRYRECNKEREQQLSITILRQQVNNLTKIELALKYYIVGVRSPLMAYQRKRVLRNICYLLKIPKKQINPSIVFGALKEHCEKNQLIPRKPALPKHYNDIKDHELREILPIRKRYDLPHVMRVLRERYTFGRWLPSTYISFDRHKMKKPLLPEDYRKLEFGLDKLFPIPQMDDNAKRHAYIGTAKRRLREKYFCGKRLPRSYFTLQNGEFTIKTGLPNKMEIANETTGTNFPVQKKELVPQLVKLRKYYHFDRIPTHWIIKRKPIPSLPSVTREIKTFIPNNLKVPIESATKTKETVKFLRRFYIFKRLNDTFFTNSRIIDFSILDGYNQDQRKGVRLKPEDAVPDPAKFWDF